MTKSTKPKSATSYKETAYGILPRAKIVQLELAGMKSALLYVIDLSQNKKPITPAVILAVHRKGFGRIFPKWAGKFRTIEVNVGNYEPPHHIQIPELVKNLCDDLNERLKFIPKMNQQELFLSEIIKLTAWFQHRFVWIHPFCDYNGRTARLLTNLIFLELGLPIPEIKAETGADRKRYIQAMIAADLHDYTKLEELISLSLSEALTKV